MAFVPVVASLLDAHLGHPYRRGFAMTPEQARIRGELGATKRHHPDNQQKITELTLELKASTLASHIEQLVSTWPPLSAEQRDKLALLLRGNAA